MVEFYKTNHPMFGQTHTKQALALISKRGAVKCLGKNIVKQVRLL